MPLDKEKNTFGKRARRYAAVTKTAAGVGVRVLGKRTFSGTKNAPAEAALLRAALGGLKGPLMKIAQMLAAIPGLLPETYAQELAQLQSNAPPMSAAFVHRRMAAELGADWKTRFNHFDVKPAAAASLGQIHRASASDGRALACKLQYPDMSAIVEADLTQLSALLRLLERFGGAVRTKAAHGEIAARLREELDYTREAQRMTLFAAMLADTPKAHVPQLVPALCTPRLLTMTWLPGESLSEAAATRSQTQRNALAETLFRVWYAPFYRYGVLHGDAHPGNYSVRPDGSINLYDFGCVRVFEPRVIEAVVTLYHALRDHDEALMVEAFRLWGFKKLSKAMVETLSLWARFIYAPFLQDRVQTMDETNSVAQGRATATQIYRELKSLGGADIPPEFVFLDRASIGLGSVFLRLGASLNWHRLLEDFTNNFSPTLLAEKQREAGI